jgi:hypothetical protein
LNEKLQEFEVVPEVVSDKIVERLFLSPHGRRLTVPNQQGCSS